MEEIKNLVNELRDSIKKDKELEKEKVSLKKDSNGRKEKKTGTADKVIDSLVKHKTQGGERLMIQLDDKTMFLLRQLKIAKRIDMNTVISYSVHLFFSKHPELIQLIKEHFNNHEL